jgi:putative nucleotidyltransferase with HDIG domain
MNAPNGLKRIHPSQLRVGVYVVLDEHWMRHPFIFNSFVVATEKDLRLIQELGLDSVLWRPDKSKETPLPVPVAIPEIVDQEKSGRSLEQEALRQSQAAAKRERIERLQELRRAVQDAEKHYERVSEAAKTSVARIHATPAESAQTLLGIAGELVKDFASDDSTLHLLGVSKRDTAAHSHAMGVMVLSGMIARGVGMAEAEAAAVALGGLLHDIGRTKVGESIWKRKAGEMTAAELSVFKMHPVWGEELLRGVPLPQQVHDAILMHHERLDGSGYPKKMRGDAIPLAARVVGLADRYETLSNPYSLTAGLQPYQALAKLYSEERDKFDGSCLKALIDALGVYPPGTFVELTNGQWGIVTSFDRGSLTRPTVELYDPDVPKSEAMLVNLSGAEEVSIARAVLPNAMPQAALDYLAPRRHMAYFLSSSKA